LIKLAMFRCALLASSVVFRKGDDDFQELRMQNNPMLTLS
jgi:hypothetical protein